MSHNPTGDQDRELPARKKRLLASACCFFKRASKIETNSKNEATSPNGHAAGLSRAGQELP